MARAPGGRWKNKNSHLLPGTHSFQESDARWANATVVVDEDNLVPVPLGFDLWMHFGDGEFGLTDPVDSTTVTGVEVNRVHDGGCGVMQHEQLQSPANRDTVTRAWKEIAQQLPTAAAHARRRALRQGREHMPELHVLISCTKGRRRAR